MDVAIYLNKKFPGKILIGEEISVMIEKKRIVHILVYFLNCSKGELKYSNEDVKLIRQIHEQFQNYREDLQALFLFLKKYAFIRITCAHPFSKTAFSRFIFTKGQEIDRQLIRLIVENCDCIEIFNGSYSELENYLAKEFALKYGLGYSAGSDAHEKINDIERGIISMPGSTYVEAEAKSIDDFFSQMKRRRIRIVGTKYKLDKVRGLIAKKYFIHWSHITNRIDRAVKPLSHIIFVYGMASHFAGYRNKLKTLAKKMGLHYRKYLREEFNEVVDIRKAK